MNKINSKLKTQNSKLWNLGFGARKYRTSRGYTLIEMLISVTILAGLLIIVLGTVAASSSSSAKVGSLREKTELARSLIDQISNDLNYIDTKATFTIGDKVYSGYLLEPNRLILVLHLPKTDRQTELVRKEYRMVLEQPQQRLTLKLSEGRQCQLVIGDDLDCDKNTSESAETIDLLPEAYSLIQETRLFESTFGGIGVLEARVKSPPISPYITLAFTIKPVDVVSTCTADPGTCYKVSTTFNVGTQ